MRIFITLDHKPESCDHYENKASESEELPTFNKSNTSSVMIARS